MIAGRRFTREHQNADHQKAVFSKLAARNKIREKQLQEDKLKSIEKNVVLLRRYRKGDLPDIQISYSDLISPILQLCQQSKDVSKVLFHDILKGIFALNSELLNDEAIQDFTNIINQILHRTEVQSSDFIIEILDLCLDFSSENSLDSARISQVCQAPGLERSGVLLLEKYLSEGRHSNLTAKRMKRTKDCTGKVDLFIQLTELYRSAGEHENVKGVFIQNQDEMNVHKDTGPALNLEANGSWSAALKLYKKLLEDTVVVDNHLPQEVEIWQKGYYLCHEKLGKWEPLSNSLTSTFPGMEWNIKHHQCDVKAFLTGAMHVSLVEGNSEIYNFLNKSFESEDQKTFLVKNCPLELSVLFSLRERYAEAIKVCQDGMDSLRNSIFVSKVCAQEMVLSQLLQLQVLQELLQYSQEKASPIENLSYNQKLWTENVPSHDSDLNRWDTVLSVRGLISGKNALESTKALPDLNKMIASSYAELAFASVNQKNSHFAQRCLKKMKYFGQNDEDIQRKRFTIISKVALMNYLTRTDLSPIDHFCSVFKSHCHLNKEVANTTHDIQDKDVIECLFKIAKSNSNVFPSVLRRQMKTTTELEQFQKMFGQVDDSNESLIMYLVDNISRTYSSFMQDQADCGNQPQILYEGSSFMHELWRTECDLSYGKLSMELHMKALEAGSRTAREMIPRALNVVISSPECGLMFLHASQSVPSWMFLPWRDQLISALHNEAISKYFIPLTGRLVENYGNAMAYAIKSASENMDLTDTTLNVFLNLMAKLKFSPVHENLLQKMELLVSPSVAFGDLKDRCLNAKKIAPKTWKQKAATLCQEFKDKYLRNSDGHAFKVFAKEFSSKVDKIISCFSFSAMEDIKREVDLKFSRVHLNRVKDYSPFLAEFQSSNFTDLVEIPGQYTGFDRPDPDRHVTLSCFDPGLHIFSSLRKPFEIRMLGSDGKKYRFILKAGEDLRQDQRIESLFDICNLCIAQDAMKNKDMKIRTYGIIPLNKTFGLIEFVPHTRTMKDFMNFDPKAAPELTKARKMYMDGMAKIVGESFPACFVKSGKPKEDAVIRNYLNTVNSTDPNYLRNGLMMISSSPQGFFYLRKNFISSYAVVCLMQWILGEIQFDIL